MNMRLMRNKLSPDAYQSSVVKIETKTIINLERNKRPNETQLVNLKHPSNTDSNVIHNSGYHKLAATKLVV